MNNKVCKLTVLAWHAPPPPSLGGWGVVKMLESLCWERGSEMFILVGGYIVGGKGGGGGSRNFEVKIKIA